VPLRKVYANDADRRVVEEAHARFDPGQEPYASMDVELLRERLRELGRDPATPIETLADIEQHFLFRRTPVEIAHRERSQALYCYLYRAYGARLQDDYMLLKDIAVEVETRLKDRFPIADPSAPAVPAPVDPCETFTATANGVDAGEA
jgi:hypothetical protein